MSPRRSLTQNVLPSRLLINSLAMSSLLVRGQASISAPARLRQIRAPMRDRLWPLRRRDRGKVADRGESRERLALELANPLASQVELVADRLERPRLTLEP